MADILEKFIEAGKIASSVRRASRDWAKPGVTLLELADKIESAILKAGAGPAFPANLSLNEIAAHYTPTADDKTEIKQGDVLKTDLGVQVDGCVADTAFTLCLDPKYDYLVKAVEEALQAAIVLCKPGTPVSDLSEAIEHAIRANGAIPISNLTGHGVGQYIVHMEPAVPNVKTLSGHKLRDGQTIAIEPFATTPQGAGMVRDTNQVLIFRLAQTKAVRNQDARRILEWAGGTESLPFAQRWFEKELKLGGLKLNLAMKELIDREILEAYPALREAKGQIVAQAEHTVIVGDEPVVTTA